MSPRVGRIIGERGGRSVLAVSAVVLAAGLVVLGLALSLPVLLMGRVLLGIGMGCGLYDLAFATLGRLYGADARPAITILTLWGGFASIVSWLMSVYRSRCSVLNTTRCWSADCPAGAGCPSAGASTRGLCTRPWGARATFGLLAGMALLNVGLVGALWRTGHTHRSTA